MNDVKELRNKNTQLKNDVTALTRTQATVTPAQTDNVRDWKRRAKRAYSCHDPMCKFRNCSDTYIKHLKDRHCFTEGPDLATNSGNKVIKLGMRNIVRDN